MGAQNPGATQSIQFRALHRNGAWRVLEAIGKRFEMESTVAGYVLNSRDITERKRSDEAVRQANETLRAVIETSPLAIYTLDLEGVVRTWNSSAQKMFGYTEEEAVGAPLPTIFRGDRGFSPASGGNQGGRDQTGRRNGDFAGAGRELMSASGRLRCGMPKAQLPESLKWSPTIPSASGSKSNSGKRKRWRPWEGWPAAWRTISTIC